MALTVTLKWTAVLGAVLLATQASAEETPALKSLKDKVSYGIGVDMARSFKLRGIEPDLDLVIKGLKDELSGKPLLVSNEELRTTLSAFRHELSRRQWLAAKTAAEENKSKGDAFLAENAKKEGVVSLASGLQYKVLKAGDGRKPKETDTVTCNYRGILIDGSELDSSEAGKPAIFKLTEVIPGWREALQLMPVGSKWQLVVPPRLAYGERGADARIGPNATLIFEVELINPGKPPALPGDSQSLTVPGVCLAPKGKTALQAVLADGLTVPGVCLTPRGRWVLNFIDCDQAPLRGQQS